MRIRESLPTCRGPPPIAVKILLLTNRLPYPLHDGYNLHIYNLVRRLAAEHEFHLAALGTEELPHDVGVFFKSVQTVPPRDPGGRSLLGRVLHAFRVDQVFDFDPAMLKVIEDVIEREGIDLIWTAGAKMLVYSHRLSGLPVLADLADEAAKEAIHDVKRARSPIRLVRSLKNLANTWRYQEKYLAHVGVCTVVAGPDKRMLARNCPGVDVRVVPNGVDSEFFAPQGVEADFPSLIFEGTMDFEPNLEGIQFFCREVLPMIRAARPDVRLYIVGKNPVPAVQALANDHVTVTGFVDDVRPWVEKSSVFVCPLLRGAGIKNKILQAWSLECPVVATSVSCGGLPGEEGVNIEVADEPREFAERVLALLDDDDRRRAMGRAGRTTVIDKCSWEAMASLLNTILHELQSGGGVGSVEPARSGEVSPVGKTH